MSGRLSPCLRLVPGFCFRLAPEGSTTVKVMDAVQPDPVALIVQVAARSGAVNLTVGPLVEDRVPLPGGVHVALPSENVRSTSSPTPTFVRARFAGAVAIV